MSESQPTIDLANLFDQALKAVVEQREEINALDSFNGNHGDNMVSNMRVVADTIHAHSTEAPTEALRYAGLRLGETGQGSTSQYYADGLLQAAQKFEGQSQLVRADGMTLLETLLGAIPAESAPGAQPSAPSVFDMVLGMAGAQQPQAQPQPQSQLGGVMGLLGGLLGGQPQPSPQPQPQLQPQSQLGGVADLLGSLLGAPQPQAQPQSAGPDWGDLLARLLPAGLAYMQAQQAGADPATKRLAFIRALLGAQPRQAQTPRQAAGTVIAQSILQALLAR